MASHARNKKNQPYWIRGNLLTRTEFHFFNINVTTASTVWRNSQGYIPMIEKSELIITICNLMLLLRYLHIIVRYS